MILARALVRIVTFVLLVALALLGLAAAIAAVALTDVTELLGLPQLRDTVGGWFDDLGADGPTAVASGLAGLGAVVLGLLLLFGLLLPRRERLVQLDKNEHGTLNARRRALAQVATQLTEQVRGVSQAKVKIRPKRRSGGRMRVRADRPRAAPEAATKSAVTSQLEALTGPFKLKAAVQTRVGQRGSRVQ